MIILGYIGLAIVILILARVTLNVTILIAGVVTILIAGVICKVIDFIGYK